MKKVMTSAAIVATLLVSGCASYSSPWDFMPYQEAQEWKGIGVTAYNAKQFRSRGFTPLDVKPWVQAGIKSPAMLQSREIWPSF